MPAALNLRNPSIAKLHRSARRPKTLSKDARVKAEALRHIRRRLDKRLREIREQTRRASKAVTRVCQAARKRITARTKRERAEARAIINAKRDRETAKAKSACKVRRERVRGAERTAIASALLAADHERGIYQQVYSTGKGSRALATERRKERQQESDQEVERNIDTTLVPVWRQVKRRIRADARRTRTEAFEEWVHDNRSEVKAMLADLEAKQIASEQSKWAARQRDWEREQHQKEREQLAKKFAKQGMSRAQAAKAARFAAQNPDVPF